jgi:glucosamine--fructose-6-phosphate aminotransferase (isomerizing)
MDLLWISDRDDDALGPMRIALPSEIPEWATPMVAIIGAQLFCHHLALTKGLDPDAPAGLQKVTRTH